MTRSSETGIGLVRAERLVPAPCFAQAQHLAAEPCLSLSSFCALLEFKLLHFDDSVGVLAMIVLSASGLLVEEVVAVSVVVTWPVVAVAVRWHVVVTVVSWVMSVLVSLLWAAAVQLDLVVFVAVHVLSSSPGRLRQVSSFLACFSQQVVQSERTLDRGCSV